MQSNAGIRALMRSNLSIPTLPEVVLRINELIERPDTGCSEIGTLVAEDAPLATKVLRLANSAYYGLAAECTSMEHASTVLGVRVLKNIVTQISVIQKFEHLDEDVKRHRTSLELFSRREQEAKIEDAMNRAKLVNVHVVQRPGLPLVPVDNRRASVLLALISGLAASLGGAFGVEYLNRTLRFEREVERYLGLPVLAEVQDTRGQS